MASLPDNPRAPLRGATYKTIFALLYGLGLRVGEVSRLQLADVDLGRQLLVIRDAKFGKTRLVPFGPRIGDLLRDYLELRGASLQPEAAVFSFTTRGSVHPGTISHTFHQLVPRLGLVLHAGIAPPRVHDLRHAFAVVRHARCRAKNSAEPLRLAGRHENLIDAALDARHSSRRSFRPVLLAP